MQIDRRAALAVFALTAGGCATWMDDGHHRDPALAYRPAGTPTATLLRVGLPFYQLLPALTVPIEDKTVATRAVFVDWDHRDPVQRIVVVQYETVNAGSTFRFRYPSTPPETFGAHTYRFNAFAYDDERAAAAEPEKEAAKTRALLIKWRLKPPRYWRVARLARVVGADGRNELIVFYMENADGEFGAKPPQTDADGDIPLDAATRARLLDALRRTVQVTFDPPAGA